MKGTMSFAKPFDYEDIQNLCIGRFVFVDRKIAEVTDVYKEGAISAVFSWGVEKSFRFAENAKSYGFAPVLQQLELIIDETEYSWQIFWFLWTYKHEFIAYKAREIWSRISRAIHLPSKYKDSVIIQQLSKNCIHRKTVQNVHNTDYLICTRTFEDILSKYVQIHNKNIEEATEEMCSGCKHYKEE